MAADTVGETCFDKYFTEETFDATMVQQTELNKDHDETNDGSSNDGSSSEDNQEIEPAAKSVTIENGATEDASSKSLPAQPEQPMDVDTHNDEISENISNEINSDCTISLDNIQIQNDPLDNEKDADKKDDNVNNDSAVDKLVEENSQNVSVSTLENIILNDDGILRTGVNNSSKTPTNVVVFSPKNNFGDKQILNSDLFKGQKVFILNGNVTSKEEVEKTKPDNINIICVSNNLNDIIKNIQSEAIKPGRSLLNIDTTDKSSTMLKSADKTSQNISIKTANGPKFIQLTQNNLKSISPKISVNVTPCTPKPIAPKPAPVVQPVQVKKNFDILRTKLLENGIPSNQNSTETVKNRTTQKKDEEPDSPAVAKARSEFMKCRKQLIEAAIHPQLPTYKPPSNYEGPLYSCEECDDAFSSPDSLSSHKNRRSVLFTYACPLCKSTLEFFNRCTFLLHVRSHDAAVKACYLTISTIPADKLNFKLLQQDENENQLEKVVQRSKDRVTTRKDSDEGIDSILTSRSEVKENGTDKLMPTAKQVDKHNLLKSFDFIKSLRKSKFSTYLANIEQRKKNKPDTPSESTSEDSSADDTSDRKTSEDVSEKPMTNGESNSQLKYYLTVNKLTSKRPLEDVPDDESIKKNKVEVPSSEVAEIVKPKSQPVIIKTKPNMKDTEKSAEEITLTSSDDDDDAENESSGDVKKVICRDCHCEVPSLNKHYKADNRPLKEYPCEQCKFFNPSACALIAHNRMHTKSQPYICPDCGLFFSTTDAFQTHIKEVCYYDYKTIRFQCPECSLLKPSVPQFADHLKRCHTRDVFKCSLCITSSYSPKVVEIHMKRKHEGETGTVLEGYRCMLCPNILVSKKSIDTHINKHVFSLKHLRYVYICKRCKKYASGKISKFIQHLKACQDKKENVTKKMSPCKQKTKAKPRSTKAPKEIVEVEEKDPLSVEDWEADKLKAEFVPKAKICVMCRQQDVDSKSSSLFCGACVRYVNADDNSEASSSTEATPSTGRPKRKFKCKLCKQFMDKDWRTIQLHFQKDHHADFNVKADVKKKEDTKKNESPVNIIKKRRPSVKDTPSPKVPKIESMFAYKCCKCDLATNIKEDFRAHIVSHKEPGTRQCFECGECFIVHSTLAKHLMIKHHVRDVRSYYIDNGLLKDVNPRPEKKAVENQCEVCYLQCDSKQSYDKHIRTHGMAFVAMQSRSKDEKNPRG